MSPQTAPDPEKVRHDILAAADSRFQQFGYGKTTMAEIARDCAMSAANLYRYFDNKAEIAAELAVACLGRRLDHLRTVAEDLDTPGPERIERWIVESLMDTWENWTGQPRMNELVDDVCSTRMDIVHDHYHAKHKLLTAMLRTATERGELDVQDPEDAAGAILTACISFDVPHFMHMCTIDEHREKAIQLARLLVTGMMGKT